MRVPKLFRLVLVLMAFTFVTSHTEALTLYSTSFEEFTAGYDQWVGTNGWQGNSVGAGVHGIDQDVVVGAGLGKTAFLGYNRPTKTFVTVFRPFLYNPITSARPVVTLDSVMMIVDSTNDVRDSFFYTVYNSAGKLLAAIRFDNTDLNYGIWKLNGTNQVDTGIDFIRSELYQLFATIDFSNNLWTADLNGIPLFTNAQFNATGQPRDLGYVAMEWQLTGATTNEYGDNWMLISDMFVRSYPISTTSFSIEQMSSSTSGTHSVNWTGDLGFDYAVQYSDNLVSWTSGLPNSVFTNIQSTTPLSFISSTNVEHRFYRVSRTLTP